MIERNEPTIRQASEFAVNVQFGFPLSFYLSWNDKRRFVVLAEYERGYVRFLAQGTNSGDEVEWLYYAPHQQFQLTDQENTWVQL